MIPVVLQLGKLSCTKRILWVNATTWLTLTSKSTSNVNKYVTDDDFYQSFKVKHTVVCVCSLEMCQTYAVTTKK